MTVMNPLEKKLEKCTSMKSQRWDLPTNISELGVHPICLELGALLIYSATSHRLQTPNEGMNQRNLKLWANVVDKICFGSTYKFGIGI